jgi:peptidyl-prolyl cis-trans isomerase SurA
MHTGYSFRGHASHVFVVTAFLCSAAGASIALAQTQSLPGVVVTSPQNNSKSSGKWQTKSKQDRNGTETGKSKTAVSSYQSRRSGNVTRPVVIVNGTPITNEEIDMRANLLSLNPELNERVKREFQSLVKSKRTAARWQATQQRIIQENQFSASVDQIKAKLGAAMRQMQQEISQQAFQNARAGFARTLRGRAKQDLIDEQIKLNAPRELGIKMNDANINSAVDRVMADRAKKVKKTPKEYAAHLRKLGTDESMMRQSIRAQFIWREVVRTKYRPFISPNLKEVDEVITSAPVQQEGDDPQLKLHRITVSLPAKASEKQKIRGQLAAENLMQSFKGCTSTAKVAATQASARFEDLGTKRLSEIPEPARSLLRHAKPGDMLPPQPAAGGLHLYALCERASAAQNTEETRKQAEAQIVSEHLDRRARGLLLDLRRRARIEER